MIFRTMSKFLLFLSVFLLSLFGVRSLKCYTGYALIRGQTVGTTSEECENDGDYCYNASIYANFITEVKKAGCSMYRCLLNHNKCIKQELWGSEVNFCCCNGRDFCNSSIKPGISHYTLLFSAIFSIFFYAFIHK